MKHGHRADVCSEHGGKIRKIKRMVERLSVVKKSIKRILQSALAKNMFLALQQLMSFQKASSR